ncbi:MULTISPECIES: inorganic phosphate transporter [Legionella]|uniref:Inorganic phosphate transporter n=1 Tax=Legionella septentrionalis TaxID=2498109 RepID=A0A433JK57_9GAMM|nr:MULTISPECIES: inorganic phosphate transporter [Legionella]MCP0914889.1 inorganic phosphate transporter [Legionella sp. 27cVA30]RUQ88838.1 inorganic phosphate transporter [Legionella septentrionalis]RUR02951.1 inorganic phosphate transporter [Legionella septentrionalis]RUR11550.1 inorganic phosphate transporter [Legionella septentrionalis]RUR16815.1 inorganic phosphate transporter [Legionella septentrionalis]
MEQGMFFILCVILIAYLFDFINGFHDAANSIATIVSTGVLTPRQAVLWAAFFNFIAFLFFNLMVAKTIGHDLIATSIIDPKLILAALFGAISWNLLTWYLGLPSSSSHALIGGLAGAAVARGGLTTLKWSGFTKVAIGIFISPVMGLAASLLLAYVFIKLLQPKDSERFKKMYKALQLASSALLSLTHGGNDAQKTMGIIAILLFSASWLDGEFYIPLWVVISCHAVISLGTLVGGWRIVHTMGSKITQLNTLSGCMAETGAAAVIFASTEYGVPVSTTQTVTGAIAGVGLISGLKGTNWRMLRIIYLSWLLTLPASGIIAAGIILLVH